METRIISCSWKDPNPPREAPKAVWPRYLNNADTRDHLSGKKLSTAVLKIEMEKLRAIWNQVQQTRYRYAVYEFLEAVYAVVSRFNRAGSGKRLLRKLHRLDSLLARIREPYAAVIQFGTEYSLDSRTRSKWSRLLRFADMKGVGPTKLEMFIRKKGGINKCAARL